MKVPVLDMDQALMKPPHMSESENPGFTLDKGCYAGAMLALTRYPPLDDRQDEVKLAVQLCIVEAEGDRDNSKSLKDLADDADSIVSTYWAADSENFYSDRDGDREIFVMDADGTNVRQLTNNDEKRLVPCVSP